MKLIFAVVIVALVGCATPEKKPIQTTPVINEPIPVEVVPAVNANQISDMMNQAGRCSGSVKFQAEIENGKTRARFSCDWTKETETNPWW